MKRLIAAALLLAACATTPAHAACPPAGYDRAALDQLKTSGWAIPDERARNAFALALTDCLASPDPALRDGIAFEGLQHLLRQRQLSVATINALGVDLEARLTAPEGAGFERPFAALVLSEVVRADRVEPYLTPERRAALLEVSLTYLAGVRDYRGFIDGEGWRHGVAHGADLMLQWTLNPALGKPELGRIRDTIAAQIAPSTHAYIHNESERLARPILYMAQRDVFTEAEWSAWFASLAAPAPFASWGEAFSSEAGLARLHNLKAFTASVYLNASLGENAADDALLPGALATLTALP